MDRPTNPRSNGSQWPSNRQSYCTRSLPWQSRNPCHVDAQWCYGHSTAHSHFHRLMGTGFLYTGAATYLVIAIFGIATLFGLQQLTESALKRLATSNIRFLKIVRLFSSCLSNSRFIGYQLCAQRPSRQFWFIYRLSHLSCAMYSTYQASISLTLWNIRDRIHDRRTILLQNSAAPQHAYNPGTGYLPFLRRIHHSILVRHGRYPRRHSFGHQFIYHFFRYRANSSQLIHGSRIIVP